MSRNNFIYFHNAVLGYAIMSLEMVANRYLAPFFGGSNIIWANIIGSVMLFLALGYYFGGRLADKYPKTRVYFGISLFAGTVTFILPIAMRLVLNNPAIIQSSQFDIIFSLIISSLAFGVPIGLMALINPFNLKLLQINDGQSNLGKQSGILSAWGTIGSLLGIYLTTFVITPYLGVNLTIIICSGLIIFSSLVGLALFKDFDLSKIKSKIQAGVSVFILIFCLICNNYSLQVLAFKNPNIIYEQETLYQKLSVYKDNLKTNYLVFDAPNNYQSKYNPDKQILDSYIDNYVALTNTQALSSKSKLNVLIIGYAGGGIGKNLLNFKNPNVEINIDGVEIDSEVTKVSQKYFNVQNDERNIHHTDGRKFVQTTNNKYDIVIIDAFQNLFIPNHLLTIEYFAEIKQIMNPEGIIGMNVISLNSESKLLSKIMNTIGTTFKKVKYYDTAKGNYTILASHQDIKFGVNNLKKTYPDNLYSEFVNNLKSMPINKNQPFTDNQSELQNLLNYDYLTGRDHTKK